MIAATLENGPEGQLTKWGDIKWHRVREIVRNLHGRIFRARKLGLWRQLLRLQKLMKRCRSRITFKKGKRVKKDWILYYKGID